MKLRIRWHPAIVLVLCGLPLFGYTAWRVYTGGKVRELTLEVDADNQVTVKARRRWVTEERSGFKLPKDERDLYLIAVMCFAREADRDDDGLPKLPVRIVFAEGAAADDVWRLLTIAASGYLWDVTLESPGRTVAFELSKDERGGAIPLPWKPRDLAIASLCLPSGSDGRWAVEELAVTLDLDRSRVDARSREDWQKVVKRADRARARTVGAVEEIDLSGFDAVGIRWGKAALARDLVRVIAAIKATDPAPKIILVVP